MSSYNLFEEPWVPVRWVPGAPSSASGELPDRVGLRELLERCQHISGLAIAEPPAHAALLRILYALTARVACLDEVGAGDWGEQRYEVLSAGRLPAEGIADYVERYRDRFFVFDPEGGRPWMQDPRLASQCDAAKTAGVNKLIMTRPAGRNHAWFKHVSDLRPDPPSVPEAVLNLLVWHYWGAAGRCSSREVNGVKSASAQAGPLRTALSYHPEGDTLFESLLAGLVPPPAGLKREDDLCPWEKEELPDPDAAPAVPGGPCGRLTACSQHALLLVPDEENPGLVRDAFITWAYRNGRIPRDDHYLVWQISQQGNRYPRRADSRRALWRDLDALLLKQADTADPQQPRVFETAAEVSDTLRVRALGFEQDGQAKDTQFVDASTPPVLRHVEDKVPRTEAAVARLRQLGEQYGNRLVQAVRRAWRDYLNEPKAEGGAWVADAEARYWPQAEEEFWRQFRRMDRTGESLDVNFDHAAARREFLRLAEDAYDTVTRNATRTQRGAKAVALNRSVLRNGFGKPSSS